MKQTDALLAKQERTGRLCKRIRVQKLEAPVLSAQALTCSRELPTSLALLLRRVKRHRPLSPAPSATQNSLPSGNVAG